MQISHTVEGWKQEGAVEHARKVVLRALTLRFGPPPPELTARIEDNTDLNELERWFVASQLASTLTAFRAATGL